jgi:hypothetical protein
MQPHLELTEIAMASAGAAIVGRFHKLRWMGLDAEAEELFAHFHDDWPSEAVVSIVPDTD